MQRKDLEKIVVGVGVGKLRQNAQFEKGILPEIIKDLTAITGQKARWKDVALACRISSTGCHSLVAT